MIISHCVVAKIKWVKVSEALRTESGTWKVYEYIDHHFNPAPLRSVSWVKLLSGPIQMLIFHLWTVKPGQWGWGCKKNLGKLKKWCEMPGTTWLQDAKRSAGQSHMFACPMQFLQDVIHGGEKGREINLLGSFHLLHSSHTCKVSSSKVSQETRSHIQYFVFRPSLFLLHSGCY